MTDLNLGCTINRVAVTPRFDKVDLFVPHNSAPDMGKAVSYAQRVFPEVKEIFVFEDPVDEFVMSYFLCDGQWCVNTSKVMAKVRFAHVGVK